ncbi:3-phenylpropionate/trans-cinnamate dioxygenase ferredoxin reductase subunit [Mycoplana sp. BE70]|uniref:NAD(P)/FAD-dependent oxidoreductase n=1 Tax=Mycoplana sp. BE70 TaxID=2817775 RepID=UPI002863BC88|nr:FAD-dependent oxidoreductase [Mycoplana sp. BE70]MDR6756250.1 3-phenylpropionate/trans-cinnamate dioxygenase ferredoxin reductase subunit [Mycoplana sp. BE70]
MTGRLVVVGGGQAAFALVAKLRALKDMRPITIVGAEASLPYQRPPLSKKYLLGEADLSRLQFRPEAWYPENDVEIRLSTEAVSIDRAAKTVTLSDGARLDYEYLALATGATPRRLPAEIGGDLKGVYTVRDFLDADRLGLEMTEGRKALVVGGGYIGLEAAAVARGRGLDVTVIEMADRILQRVASPATATILKAIHIARGVDVREKTGLARLLGEDGRVTGAELSDGTVLPADVVIVGIGIAPNDRLARDAGLEVSNGIVVDAFARTSDPAIFAMGDCAVLPFEGRMVRLESVQNAVDQAEAAAAVIAGGDEPYVPKPWFWSDQYDVKLQIAGFCMGYDDTLVRPGQREGSVSVWYFREGRFIAVDAVNDAKAYVVGKKLLELGRSPDRTQLEDPALDLKTLTL